MKRNDFTSIYVTEWQIAGHAFDMKRIPISSEICSSARNFKSLIYSMQKDCFCVLANEK